MCCPIIQMRWYHRKDECVLSIFAEEAKEECQNVALGLSVPWGSANGTTQPRTTWSLPGILRDRKNRQV